VAGSRPFLYLSRVVLHLPTVNDASSGNLHQPYRLCNLHIPTHVAASSNFYHGFRNIRLPATTTIS
jgi:hypothetical protein